VTRRRALALGAGLAAIAAAVVLAPQIFGLAGQFGLEVRRLESRNRAQPPEPGGIVFVGSSSIRFWGSLARDMAPLPVSNQGFGGSHIEHVTRYTPRLVLPHRPRLVVVYAGDNDLAGDAKTPESVSADFATLVRRIHAALPKTRIYFLAIKPSIRRWDRWPRMREANRRIADACADDPRLVYVDVATPMLGSDGKPREELFVFDGLHLSEDGYALWTSILRPRLQRDWRRLSDGP
jgi:lysophospholipase L1-like esterase